MFDIIFPAEDTNLPIGYEAESLALVAKANRLAARAREARGVYRESLEEKIKEILYDATACPPGAYGGRTPYITKGGVPWRKPWVI